MKLFRPESRGYVKNIQTGKETSGSAGKKTGGGKRAILEKDRFFWIQTSKIVEIKKNSQGITTEIHLASGTELVPVNYRGSFRQSAKKQGLSMVVHHLEFTLDENDILLGEAGGMMRSSVKLSVLHVDRYGDGFFYGEEKGLSILSLEKDSIVLEGSENNVFYEMTRDCLKRLIPKTE